MIALRWRQPEPAIVVRWRGPDEAVAAEAIVSPPAPMPVAALIGPPGVAGPPGPVAEIIDGGTFN
ncbi:MAG: hypothetical protein ACRCY3_07025 [Sphingorhabdus sp.]